MKLIRSDFLAVVFLAVWQFAYHLPVSLGWCVFSGNDIVRLFLPIRIELARAFAEGRLPLWTSGIEAGFPLFAEGEVAALYPPNLFALLIFSPPMSLSYTILFHLAWAAVGMYLLVRSAGMSLPSAWLAGWTFGSSGFFLAHTQHAPHLAVGSWLPWLVLCQQRYWRARWVGKRAVGWFGLMSLCVGLQEIAGFPQMAMLNLGTFSWLGIFAPRVWRQSSAQPPATRSDFVHAALVTVASIALGTGLAAVQLLPSAELLELSVRGQGVERGFFTSHSLELAALTQFLVPFWQLGPPSLDNMEFWAYVGIVPIFFALLAVGLRQDARTWLLGLLGLVALAFALGDTNPLYQLLYHVPVFNRFRVPARFLFVFTFAATFLAAIGFDELQKRLRESSRTILPGWLIGGFALSAAAVVFLAYQSSSEYWMDAWRWLPALLILLGVGSIIAVRKQWLARNVWSVAVVGLTVLDLLIFSVPFRSSLNVTSSSTDLTPVPRTIRVMDDTEPLYRVFADKFHSFSLSQSAVRAALLPNLSLTYGKQGVATYLPLALQRNEAYIAEMSPAMRNLMNIRYYLLPIETVPPGEPSPLDESAPEGGLTLALLSQPQQIPPTRVTQVVVTSYTDQTAEHPDSFVVGEIVLRLENGQEKVLPLRLGVDTADWAYDELARLGRVKYAKPPETIPFPAYLSSVGREFQGHRYVARYAVAPNDAPLLITAIGVRSFLSGAGLTVEHISLAEETENAVSLAALLHRNDLALAFRSHTAAMWENRSVMPRAFMAHAAEAVNDDQILARIVSPGFDPKQLVLLSDVPPPELLVNNTPLEANDEVALVEYKSERVVAQVKTDTLGYLVLTDSWYPGWIATVDGAAVPIYRANYIFRAVLLPPGQHSIVFEYRPVSFFWGCLISGISAIICGIAIVEAVHLRLVWGVAKPLDN